MNNTLKRTWQRVVVEWCEVLAVSFLGILRKITTTLSHHRRYQWAVYKLGNSRIPRGVSTHYEGSVHCCTGYLYDQVTYYDIRGVIPLSLQFQAQIMLASLGWYPGGESARSHVRAYQCVSVVRVMEVPVLSVIVAAAVTWLR